MRNPYDINRGDLDELTQNVPGPGALATFTNDAFGRVRVLLLSFRYAADVNVANRSIRIIVVRGPLNWTVGIANLNVTALQVLDCVAAPGTIGQASSAASNLQIAMPDILLIEPGDQLQIDVTGIQVGDQISLIHNDVLVFPIVI